MTPSTWKLRQARIAALRDDLPHAEELLDFYTRVLALQEPLCREAGRVQWPAELHAAAGGSGPRLRLEYLTGAVRDRAFEIFLKRVSAVATDVLVSVADRLRAADPQMRIDLLQTYLCRGSLDATAAALDCRTPPLEFFPRAFLQPVAEALLEKYGRDLEAADIESGGDDTCPQCGWPPVVGVLRDEPEVKGRRFLVCSLCSSEWAYPRARCPSCGETRTDQIQLHVTDLWPHVRIEECSSCHTYLKSIDLREDGRAVPVVDELASVELDLWAADEGMLKPHRNLLGL